MQGGLKQSSPFYDKDIRNHTVVQRVFWQRDCFKPNIHSVCNQQLYKHNIYRNEATTNNVTICLAELEIFCLLRTSVATTRDLIFHPIKAECHPFDT